MLKKIFLVVLFLVILLAYKVITTGTGSGNNTKSLSNDEVTEQVYFDDLKINQGNQTKKKLQSIPRYSVNDLLPKPHQGTVIKHDSYALSYVEDYELSEWVAHQLTIKHIRGQAKRRSRFKYDPLIKTKSASHKDLTNSGFDRGHLLPAADRKSRQKDMNQTFYMSNVAPQDRCLNQKGWRKLEEEIRKQLPEYDSLFIVTGTVVTKANLTLGDNDVVVPQYFYKIILDYKSFCSSTYLVPNSCLEDIDKSYQISIDSLEKISGIDFFGKLPKSFQTNFESQVGCLDI